MNTPFLFACKCKCNNKILYSLSNHATAVTRSLKEEQLEITRAKILLNTLCTDYYSKKKMVTVFIVVKNM
jgi:hypothetical protein